MPKSLDDDNLRNTYPAALERIIRIAEICVATVCLTCGSSAGDGN